MTVSKILKDKSAEEIKFPAATPFEVGGTAYPILPMPDRILVGVAKEIGGVAALLQTLSAKKKAGAADDDEEPSAPLALTDLDYTDVLEIAPEIVQIFLPAATKIIAASLRQPESWVQDTLFYRDRLRALRLILTAEDIPALLGEFQALTGIFTTPSPGPAPTT